MQNLRSARMHQAYLVAALALSGCQQPTPAPTPTPAEPSISADAPSVPPVSRRPTSAKPERLVAETEQYFVSVVYPAAAAQIPKLQALFLADFAQGKRDVVADVQEAQLDIDEGATFSPPCSAAGWTTVADTSRWISLVGQSYWFSTGMAHPNAGFILRLWDKRDGTTRQFRNLVVSLEKLAETLQPAFCKVIDAERARRRGAPVRGNADFSECLDPTDHLIVPGSSDGRALDRLDIYVNPYEAGPFSEGSYHVRLPVTPAVIAALRADYAQSFAVGTEKPAAFEWSSPASCEG